MAASVYNNGRLFPNGTNIFSGPVSSKVIKKKAISNSIKINNAARQRRMLQFYYESNSVRKSNSVRETNHRPLRDSENKIINIGDKVKLKINNKLPSQLSSKLSLRRINNLSGKNRCKSCLTESNKAIITALNRENYVVFFKCLNEKNDEIDGIFSCDPKDLTVIPSNSAPLSNKKKSSTSPLSIMPKFTNKIKRKILVYPSYEELVKMYPTEAIKYQKTGSANNKRRTESFLNFLFILNNVEDNLSLFSIEVLKIFKEKINNDPIYDNIMNKETKDYFISEINEEIKKRKLKNELIELRN
jgi:hypothetical protein